MTPTNDSRMVRATGTTWTPTFQFAVVRETINLPLGLDLIEVPFIVDVKQKYRNTQTGESEWRDVPEFKGEE